jgi:phenylacetate-CoA ligase
VQRRIWDPEVECMPLPQLVELCQSKFRESKIMERAARSPLYRDRWAAAGVVADQVRRYDELRKVPFTTGADLRVAQAEHDLDELICTEHPRYWVSTSGTTGSHKWIPIGDGDVLSFSAATLRLLTMALDVSEGWSLLYVNAPAPFGSESSGYYALVGQILYDGDAELTFCSLPEIFDAINFARMAQTEGFQAMPSMAMLLAERVAQGAGQGAREQFKKERTLGNLLRAVAASVLPIKASNVFKFKWGVFGGEPVDPYRSALKESYGLRPATAYAASEFLASASTECRIQNGMHLPMDNCLPEIIPQEELDKEDADASYVPQAIPLWEAAPGLIGEFVITTFADALPLVRYRTSDLITVVSTDPCECGRTHPRIKVRHRSDDIVNMGLMRFSIYQLKEKMEEVGVHGQVAKWQLRLTRENTKAKGVLLVQPRGEVADREAFVKELEAKMDELKGIKQSWENGLIAKPEARLVDEVVEKRTMSGKIRYAIYEDDYLKEA